MQHVEELSSNEGGFYRTGSRAPVQWVSGPSAGFSTAPVTSLCLPVDPSPDAPSVGPQTGKPGSLPGDRARSSGYQQGHSALCADGELQVIHTGYPFVYPRSAAGEDVAVAVNRAEKPASLQLETIAGRTPGRALLSKGAWLRASEDGMRLEMGAVSYRVFELA